MDLCIDSTRSNIHERKLALVRAVELGWNCLSWNTMKRFGELAGSKPQSPLVLNALELKQALKQRNLVIGDAESGEKGGENVLTKQTSRITVVVDNAINAQSLTAGNSTLRAFDVVAARTSDAKTFEYLCTYADVDIISLDFSQKVPFPLDKKLLDTAVTRGVYFELQYIHLLNSKRKNLLSGAQILIQYLRRGRNIVLSSGATTSLGLRGPLDVEALGSAMGMSEEACKLALRGNCKSILAHGESRRRKYGLVELMKTEDVKTRWPNAFENENVQDDVKGIPQSIEDDNDIDNEDNDQDKDKDKDTTMQLEVMEATTEIENILDGIIDQSESINKKKSSKKRKKQ
jgi:RNase P/RNase MRP subunit p30